MASSMKEALLKSGAVSAEQVKKMDERQAEIKKAYDQLLYRDMHLGLGCSGCVFAISEKVFKEPCCNAPKGPHPDSTGACTNRVLDLEAGILEETSSLEEEK